MRNTPLLTFGFAVLGALALSPRSLIAAEDQPPPQEVQRDPFSSSHQVIPRKLALGAGHGDTLSFGFFHVVNGVTVAMPEEKWTWDHGGPDPFEGWTATDRTANGSTWFRHLTQERWAARGNEGEAPIPAGNGCAWLGAFRNEADSLCWKGGAGYGNNWCQVLVSPKLHYDGSGSVRLRFQYFCDTEPMSDRVLVVLRIDGKPDLILNDPGFGGIVGTTPSGPWGVFNREITKQDFGGYLPRDFHLLLQFDSDDESSDEDGLHATPFGPFAIDDVTLSGGIPGKEIAFHFEEGLGEWSALFRSGIGTHFSISLLEHYRIETAGSCGLSGNVATFHDADDQHPDGQYVMAFSPPVDRTEYPGYGNIFADWDMYGVMPASNGVFYRAGWSYWPYLCPTTKELIWSPRVGDPTWQYTGGEPMCLHRRIHAASLGVPADCQKIRFVFEVASSCTGFGIQPTLCTGLTNFSPAVDNVRVLMTREPVGKLALEQLSFENADSIRVLNSDIGRVRFQYAPEEPGYLNVAIRRPERPEVATWAVRNVTLPGGERGRDPQEISARFSLADLSIPMGQPVDRLSYAWTLSPNPIFDEDYAVWLEGVAWQPPAELSRVSVDAIGAGTADAAVFPLAGRSFPRFQPFQPPAAARFAFNAGPNASNLNLDEGDEESDRQGSFPAAVANALRSLGAADHVAALDGEARESYRDLEHLLSRSRLGETDEQSMIRILLDYIEAYELPVQVRYRSRFHGGSIASTSGLTRAECRNESDTGWPDIEQTVNGAASGEFVVLVIGAWIQDGESLRRHDGVAALLTGAATVAGVTKLTVQYDGCQRNGKGLVREQTEVQRLEDGTIHLPGLDKSIRRVSDGAIVPAKAFLETAVSLEIESGRKPLPEEQNLTEYGQWFFRTIPPHHRLSIRYPESEDRGFKTSVLELQRASYPPRLVKTRVWNWNSKATRRVVNGTDRCMTVAVQNEDWPGDVERYERYSVKLTMEKAALDEASSAGNEESCGGFLVGALDGKSDEFDPVTGSSASFLDGVGNPLSGVPRVLGSSGVASLTISRDVAEWNPYWSKLSVHFGVAAVKTAGMLRIDCPQAGYSDSLKIDRSGNFSFDLGTIAPSPRIDLTLSAGSGLELELDGVGLAAQTRPGPK